MPGFLHFLRFFWLYGLVYAGLLFWVVLGVTFLPLSFWSFSRPDFALMALYVWRLWTPELVTPYIGFILGMFADLLYGTPVGLHALCWVGLCFFLGFQRTMLVNAGFWTLWGSYGVSLLLVASVQHGLLWLFFAQVPPGTEMRLTRLPTVLAVVLQFLASVAIFPAFYSLNRWIYRWISSSKLFGAMPRRERL